MSDADAFEYPAAMLRRYIREGSLFRENAAGAVGL